MMFSGTVRVEIDGKHYTENRERPQANFEQVTGSFFAVTSQKLLEGRTFSENDLDERLPVAIVNAAFVRKHYGNDRAIGRRVRSVIGTGTQFGSWRTIVGVVSNVRMLGPFNNRGVDDSGFYVPFHSPVVAAAGSGTVVSQFGTVV